MGHVRNASQFFKQANNLASQSAVLSRIERKRLNSKARINDGLIYLATDDFPAASASFDEVGGMCCTTWVKCCFVCPTNLRFKTAQCKINT